jgi:hypothetical protein
MPTFLRSDMGGHCTEIAFANLRARKHLPRRGFVKTTSNRFLVLCIAVALVLSACHGREKAATEATETIAPAAPQPQPTGTDAMTQTVDIEDSRSEAEGAALTDTRSGVQPTATGTTATAATSTSATSAAAPPPATTTR